MRYLMVILICFILVACKGNKLENTTANNEVLEQENNTSNLGLEVLAQDKTNTNIIDIPICHLDKRDKEVYAMFVKPNEMTFKNELKQRLYFGSGKKAFDKLFLSEQINCIVPVSGGGYTIFDMYYNDEMSAEIIYENVIELNEKLEDEKTYHDFFKRGLVFILSKEKNKLTIVSFNPFYNNELPNEIKGFFKDESKFDQVCMIIGMGQVEILVQ